MTPTISVTIPEHGRFETWTNTLDSTMRHYADCSLAELQSIVAQRTLNDFSDVRDRSALLVVIADYEGF